MNRPLTFALAWLLLLPVTSPPLRAGDKPRARTLGIPFDGEPGPLDAITDVAGVEVGHTTVIQGDPGPLVVGQGPVRTGVTAILPRGKTGSLDDPVFAGVFSLNGNGEMTGTAWVEESGFLEGPVVLTNTHSVGVARDSVIAWRIAHGQADTSGFFWSLPVVAETWDGWLNDANGFHVKAEHVFQALDAAASGPVTEGNVGGGTGNIAYEFKAGIGTASRRLGGGKPDGREMPEGARRRDEFGSIIIVVATDAPLLPHQLKRLARRAAMGLARTGSVSGNGSGDLILAFSTANGGAGEAEGVRPVRMLPNEEMNGLFTATVQAVEESIINALVAGVTMEGRDGHRVEAIPHDRLREILRRYGRLAE